MKYTLYLCCDLWWETFKNIGYEVDLNHDDIASEFKTNANTVPRIGERIDLDGYPLPDGCLKDLSEIDEEKIRTAIAGSYRIKDVSWLIELVDEASYNPEMSNNVDIILEKISSKEIHNTPCSCDE